LHLLRSAPFCSVKHSGWEDTFQLILLYQ